MAYEATRDYKFDFITVLYFAKDAAVVLSAAIILCMGQWIEKDSHEKRGNQFVK